jgi:hypothetical protein
MKDTLLKLHGLKYILKYKYKYKIIIVIINNNNKYNFQTYILRLCIGSKTFVIRPLQCTSLRLAKRVAETCRRYTTFII